jgi:DNA primase small subunit
MSLHKSNLTFFAHNNIYAGNLFPYTDIHKWLSYGHDGKHPGCDEYYFGRREFSFTLENDVYLRYKSFKNASLMEAAIKSNFPYKIDIGAVYSVDPDKRHAYAQSGTNLFTPVERELVFDIVSFNILLRISYNWFCVFVLT